MNKRLEHDLLGDMQLDADVWYGIQTQRAVDNFAITGVPISHFPELVRALAMVKKAAAMANRDLGELDPAIAATIIEVKNRVIRGEEKLYLKLNVTQGDLTIEVPAENVDLVGVRDVIGQEGLDKVFEVLRAPFTEEPTNWSRRYKANLEKLASGDVIKVSEVVRDLWRRDQDRGLSAGEKRMLAKARQILISELALAKKTDEEKASDVLDEVLAS